MKSYIHIDRAEFFAYHGVLPQERLVGNVFFVSLVVEVDVAKAAESDRLEDTLSYAEMYKIVKTEMLLPSNLLEHVAGRIVTSLRKCFPSIGEIEVTVTKKNPPIVGQMDGVSVRLVDN